MNLLRRSTAAVLCACLVLISPGIESYQALAQFQTQAAGNNPNPLAIATPSTEKRGLDASPFDPLSIRFILQNGIWAPRRMSDNLLYGPHEHGLLAAPHRPQDLIFVRPRSPGAGFLKATNPSLILPVSISPLVSPVNPGATNRKPVPNENFASVSGQELRQAARLGELLTSQVDLAEAKKLAAQQFGDHWPGTDAFQYKMLSIPTQKLIPQTIFGSRISPLHRPGNWMNITPLNSKAGLFHADMTSWTTPEDSPSAEKTTSIPNTIPKEKKRPWWVMKENDEHFAGFFGFLITALLIVSVALIDKLIGQDHAKHEAPPSALIGLLIGAGIMNPLVLLSSYSDLAHDLGHYMFAKWSGAGVPKSFRKYREQGKDPPLNAQTNTQHFWGLLGGPATNLTLGAITLSAALFAANAIEYNTLPIWLNTLVTIFSIGGGLMASGYHLTTGFGALLPIREGRGGLKLLELWREIRQEKREIKAREWLKKQREQLAETSNRSFAQMQTSSKLWQEWWIAKENNGESAAHSGTFLAKQILNGVLAIKHLGSILWEKWKGSRPQASLFVLRYVTGAFLGTWIAVTLSNLYILGDLTTPYVPALVGCLLGVLFGWGMGHELGHYLFAKSSGAKVRWYIPYRFHLGILFATPKLDKNITTVQRMYTTLGGPLMNLLLASISILMLWIMRTFLIIPLWAGPAISTFAFVNFAVGYGALIPVDPHSGGGLILRLFLERRQELKLARQLQTKNQLEISISPFISRGYNQVLRREIDLVVGGVGTLAFFITLPFVAAAIKISDGGPVFYSQARVGHRAENFNILKFRTMRHNADADFLNIPSSMRGNASDPRATPLGRFLRRYTIDELPQFLQVLKGEMSVVGFRPLKPEEAGRDETYTQNSYVLKPALTDYAIYEGRGVHPLPPQSLPLRNRINRWYTQNGTWKLYWRAFGSMFVSLYQPRRPLLLEVDKDKPTDLRTTAGFEPPQ